MRPDIARLSHRISYTRPFVGWCWSDFPDGYRFIVRGGVGGSWVCAPSPPGNLLPFLVVRRPFSVLALYTSCVGLCYAGTKRKRELELGGRVLPSFESFRSPACQRGWSGILFALLLILSESWF